MANEITVLDIRGGATDAKRADILFIYDVHEPVVLSNGTLVATPSGGLPSIPAQIVSSNEGCDFDSGTKVFEVFNYDVDDSMTPAQIAADLRTIHSNRSALATGLYTRRFSRTGTRINA